LGVEESLKHRSFCADDGRRTPATKARPANVNSRGGETYPAPMEGRCGRSISPYLKQNKTQVKIALTPALSPRRGGDLRTSPQGKLQILRSVWQRIPSTATDRATQNQLEATAFSLSLGEGRVRANGTMTSSR
jgi:hypothetical protein